MGFQVQADGLCHVVAIRAVRRALGPPPEVSPEGSGADFLGAGRRAVARSLMQIVRVLFVRVL